MKIEIKQKVDVWARAVAQRLKMRAQIPQNELVDIELRVKWCSKPGPPTLRFAVLVEENIGLECSEALFTDFPADALTPSRSTMAGL